MARSSVVHVAGVVVASGPHVGGVEHGVGAEDGLALVGEVGDVRELVAVELEHMTQGVLLLPLTAKALGNVAHVEVENIDLGLGKESLIGVGSDLGFVLGDGHSVVFEVVLSLGDALRELEHLETESLDGDDLVRVDVELLLVKLRVGDGRMEVEVMDSVREALRHDRAIVARAVGDFGLNLRGEVDGRDGSSECGKGSNKFHFNLISKIVY